MQTLDWSIVGGFVVFLVIVTFLTKRHNRSVADFEVVRIERWIESGRMSVAWTKRKEKRGQATFRSFSFSTQ